MKKIDKKYIDELQITFVGENDWKKFRDLIMLKLIECNCEDDFSKLLKLLLGSCFTSVEAINDARKQLKLKPLSANEKKELDIKFNKKEVIQDGRK